MVTLDGGKAAFLCLGIVHVEVLTSSASDRANPDYLLVSLVMLAQDFIPSPEVCLLEGTFFPLHQKCVCLDNHSCCIFVGSWLVSPLPVSFDETQVMHYVQYEVKMLNEDVPNLNI